MTADDQRAGAAEAAYEVAACAGRLRLVHVEARFGGGYGDLDGVVHQIAGNDGLLAARIDQYTDMAGGVARRCDERDLIGEAKIRIDELLEARGQYRIDRILQMIHVMVAAGVAQVLPVLPFAPPEEVSRLGKGGHPSTVDEPRIPAHVIEMQMRAQHIGDLPGREARAAQILEKGVLHVAEHVEFTLPVVADAGVDHHGTALRAQHEALEGDDHAAGRRCEVRHQPAELLHELRRGLGQQHGDVIFEAVDLDDARNVDIPHAPVPDVFSRHAHSRKVARIMSAAFSATITTGALVLPPTIPGKIDASTTLKASMPRTRKPGSTTARASMPMRQLPTGWCTVAVASRKYAFNSASLLSLRPGRTSAAR